MTRRQTSNVLIVLGVINLLGACFVYAGGQAVYSVIVGTYAKNHRYLVESGAIVEYPEAIESEGHKDWWLLHNLIPSLEQDLFKPTALITAGLVIHAAIVFGLAFGARRELPARE